MPKIDVAAMMRALAQEDALRVFASVVEATGTGAPERAGNNTISIPWTTVRGVAHRTGLSDGAVVKALAQLTAAHLTVADARGEGWQTDFDAINEAATSMMV